MLSNEQIVEAAKKLDQAEHSGQQVRPTSAEYPDMGIADAYAIQKAWMELKLREGRSVRGRKVGLTSKAMQDAMKIDEPDYGTLLDDMFFENGSDIEAARFTDPRVEVELAFVLKNPLEGSAVSLTDVMAATDYVVPAIELIAARSFRVDPATGLRRGVLDTISDNAASAGVIMGSQSIAPEQIDLRWVAALLFRNGTIEESGVAAAVLDHPANGVAWLARKFSEHDIPLEPGQVVLSGSFTRPVAVSAGDEIVADYGSLGSISCQFV